MRLIVYFYVFSQFFLTILNLKVKGFNYKFFPVFLMFFRRVKINFWTKVIIEVLSSFKAKNFIKDSPPPTPAVFEWSLFFTTPCGRLAYSWIIVTCSFLATLFNSDFWFWIIKSLHRKTYSYRVMRVMKKGYC